MKRSNLVLGASAAILAIAGAFTSKAAKVLHAQTIYTKASATSCVKHQKVNGLTQSIRVGHTAFTNLKTALTVACAHKLFTVAD